jgi:sugar lactone lactonase YvrE
VLDVTLGSKMARVVHASPRELSVIVPSGLEGGQTPVRIGGARGETAFVRVGTEVATGLHQVDNPVVDDDGALYLTYSGSRGDPAPVSVFRVRRDGFREPFVSGIMNATSMAFSPGGQLYVSSRFEGCVYRVQADGSFEVFVSDLGVACGLAFSPDGTLYVGDRSGTVFRVGSAGQATPFATLPSSVAAFHLAWGPDDTLYVTAPTLSTYDRVYRIARTGAVEQVATDFGRPQGVAFDRHGTLFVVEALAGATGVYRVEPDGSAVRVLAAASLVGLAFDPTDGSVVVVSNDTAYRVITDSRPVQV